MIKSCIISQEEKNLNVLFSVQAPIIFEGAEPDPAKYSKLELGYQILDKYLEDQAWAAGDHLTIADFSLVASVSTNEVSITNIRVLTLRAHRTLPSELPFHTQRCVKFWWMTKLFCSKFAFFFSGTWSTSHPVFFLHHYITMHYSITTVDST